MAVDPLLYKCPVSIPGRRFVSTKGATVRVRLMWATLIAYFCATEFLVALTARAARLNRDNSHACTALRPAFGSFTVDPTLHKPSAKGPVNDRGDRY